MTLEEEITKDVKYVMGLVGREVPDIGDMKLSDIVVLYRNVRQELNDKFRYEDASKVFVKEMELQRRYK